MKFFISGQIDDSDNIKNLIKQVKKAGHEITHDWTNVDVFLGDTESKKNNINESQKRAKNDINGVINCDVYVLSSNNTKAGKGMYVELGAAIALYETRGYPKVYIIGELNHLSIFYLHPCVHRKKTIQEVIEEIQS